VWGGRGRGGRPGLTGQPAGGGRALWGGVGVAGVAALTPPPPPHLQCSPSSPSSWPAPLTQPSDAPRAAAAPPRPRCGRRRRGGAQRRRPRSRPRRPLTGSTPPASLRVATAGDCAPCGGWASAPEPRARPARREAWPGAARCAPPPHPQFSCASRYGSAGRPLAAVSGLSSLFVSFASPVWSPLVTASMFHTNAPSNRCALLTGARPACGPRAPRAPRACARRACAWARRRPLRPPPLRRQPHQHPLPPPPRLLRRPRPRRR